MKLFRKALDVSIKKMLVYPNEIYMIFIHSLLSIGTTVLFWNILFSNLKSFSYSEGFIYVLAMMGILSDGVSEIFFGLRDFEYLVKDGSFDTYLYKPRNSLYLVLIERIPLVAFFEKVLIGIVGLIVVAIKFNLSFSLLNIMKGIGFMILGIIYYQMIYGIITFLSLWVENISTVRDLIFQFSNSKKYPLTIFPNLLRHFLTYIVPMSLVAYYPSVIMMNIDGILPKLYLAMPIVMVLTYRVYSYCMKKYASNGG